MKIEMKQLSIVIIMISFFGCNNPKSNLSIVFNYDYREIIISEPEICKDGEIVYFKLTSEVLNENAKDLKNIIIKKENNVYLEAKHLGAFSSNFPDSDYFYSISNDEKSIDGNLDKQKNIWFSIRANPKRKNNNLLDIFTNENCMKCLWNLD